TYGLPHMLLSGAAVASGHVSDASIRDNLHRRALHAKPGGADRNRPRAWGPSDRRRATDPQIAPLSSLQRRRARRITARGRHRLRPVPLSGRPPPASSGFTQYRLAERLFPRLRRLPTDAAVPRR